MPVPVVTCDSDVVVSYDESSRTIQLNASATNSPTSWQWTILDVPEGSTANVGVKGDFVDGFAYIEDPEILIDAAVSGSYCFQAMAMNGDGSSDANNKESQQLVVVRTANKELWIPPDYAYDWGQKYLNQTLRALDESVGGAQPFWEWNGTDLSQFDVYTGPKVTWYSARVKQKGQGLPVISMNANYAIGNEQEKYVLLVPNDVVYPSANYIVMADVGSPYAYGQGLIGARVSVDVGPYSNWMRGVFEMLDTAGSLDVHTAYSLLYDSGADGPYYAEERGLPNEDRYIDHDFSYYVYYRLGLGVEGPKAYCRGKWYNQLDLAIVRTFRSPHMFSPRETSNVWFQEDEPANIAFGLVANNGERVRFRNIRAYELKASAEGNPWI